MVIDINYIIPTAVCVSYTYFIEAAEHMMYKITRLLFFKGRIPSFAKLINLQLAFFLTHT